MKLFTFVLSFIVFSQSVYLDCAMPLFDISEGDSVECCSHSDEDTNHEEEESHQCSPFCTDDCCSTPIYLSQQLFVDDLFNESETVYFSHLNNYSFSIDLKLYHPPKK